MPSILNLKPPKDQHRRVQQAGELCYYQLMTIWNPIITAALLLVLGSSPVYSQAADNGLAADLIDVRQQQRQLEGDIEQYQKSIELLRGNLTRKDGPSPALEALKAQLIERQTNLIKLFEKEASLQQQLISERTATPGYDPEAEDVARLKALLNDFYAAEALANARARSDNASTNTKRATVDYALDKVRLSGSEGVAAIEYIQQRLAQDLPNSRRRQLDIIYHIEVRRDDDLVSSSSHSFKSLGGSFYVGKVSLPGGIATVSIRKDEWVTRLKLVPNSFYLITLYLPGDAAPELHLIPVDELKATGWSNLPPWLPPIGALPSAPAPS
jgi:hypothetical protein